MYPCIIENVCQRKCTPLYEKGIKQDQNKPMETTMWWMNK